MLTTTIALLAAFTGPMQGGPSGGSYSLLVRSDSAHTLFTPNVTDAGRSGQLYQLPQGGFGVTAGGTSYYQTLGMPGGSGVAVTNGNTANLIGSNGRIGVAHIPN
jgi:hypothetical protein